MTKYTPTTEEVRHRYGRDTADNVGMSEVKAHAEFDRWLAARDAERDRQVREELWDEVVPQYAHDWYWHDGGRELNPYRKEATGD